MCIKEQREIEHLTALLCQAIRHIQSKEPLPEELKTWYTKYLANK